MYSVQRTVSIVACSLILVTVSCNRKERPQSYRIVSLSPAMTEILFSLGAQDKIAGVTTFCDFPAQAQELTKVGDFSNPSLERIIGLKPDLVIVNLPEQARIKRELDRLGVAIFVSSPLSLSDIYGEIISLGVKLGLTEKADSLVEYMRKNIIEHTTPQRRKKVYVEISPKPIITIGKRTFLNELIHLAGATNIFEDLNKDYPVVNQETVITRNPDIIIVLHPQAITRRTGWQDVNAIKNHHVYTDLNEDHLMRPGPRLVQGFEALVKIVND